MIPTFKQVGLSEIQTRINIVENSQFKLGIWSVQRFHKEKEHLSISLYHLYI